MSNVNLKGRDLIVTQDWSLEELLAVLDLAVKMKKNRYGYTDTLKNRSFFMFFYNDLIDKI